MLVNNTARISDVFVSKSQLDTMNPYLYFVSLTNFLKYSFEETVEIQSRMSSDRRRYMFLAVQTRAMYMCSVRMLQINI